MENKVVNKQIPIKSIIDIANYFDDYNQQYSPVTDNSYTMLNGSYTTKDGDIFGKEVTEDGFIKNETTSALQAERKRLLP